MVNRIIGLSISLLFFVGYKFVTLIMYILTGQLPRGLVVLEYHSVKSEQRDRFARQMDILIKKYHPVFANIKGPLGNRQLYIAVTFDDGFQSVVENALPELHKREIPATIFIPTGYLGKKPHWISNPYHVYMSESVMTAEQLKSLSTDLVLIGSHCVTHRALTTLGEKELLKELVESKNDLERILNREVDLLAFPYGQYNKTVLEFSRKAGYNRVFWNVPTFLISNIDTFMIGRVFTSPDDWLIEFKLKLMGAYRWLPIAVVLKGKFRSLSQYILNSQNRLIARHRKTSFRKVS